MNLTDAVVRVDRQFGELHPSSCVAAVSVGAKSRRQRRPAENTLAII
jgi:hypothetical protein